MARYTSVVATIASIALFVSAKASAATIALSPGTPTYSYDILAAAGTADPNATLVNLNGTTDASYYTNAGNVNGSLTYTVSVPATGTNLKVSLINLLAFGGTGSIVGTYTLDNGSPVTLFNDVTEDLTDGNGGGGSLAFPAHTDNIALDPLSAHTIVLNYAVNSTGSNNYQQQLMRHDTGGNGGPFTLTATFVPEPTSVGLLALGSTLVIRRRRRGA